jgi:hypothetical protein
MKRTATFLLVVLLLVAGCGGTAEPTLAPADVAQQAATQMLAVNSFHFLIQLTGKPAFLDKAGTVALKQAEGDLVRPDRARAIAKVATLGLSSEIGIIAIGEKQYATNPLNQQWQEVPAESRWDLDLARLFDAETGIPAVLQKTTWTLGPDDPAVYVLRSRMPYDQLRALSLGLITSGDVEVEFRIGRQDRYVQHIQIVEVASDPQEPTTWAIDLSAFGQPVDIQPPP